MRTTTGVRALFAAAFLYDFGLGVAFLAAGPAIYDAFKVPPPSHWGYVQFPALLLLVFGLMFLAVAVRPQANRRLIPYGMLLKASYAGVVLAHWLGGGVADMFKPFAILDLVWLALFAWGYAALRPVSSADAPAHG